MLSLLSAKGGEDMTNNTFSRSARRLGEWSLRALCPLAVAVILTFTATVGDAEADRYDPKKAGNPIRISAYLLHPVGVLIDYGLMRPCFWVVQREPFSTIFGYQPTYNEETPEKD
jgi:hypothetical protein